MGSRGGLRVGITGVGSDFGQRLLPRLLADPRIEEIIAFDVAPPVERSERVRLVRIDLTRPGIETTLTAALAEARLDVLYHLAFVNSRVHGAAFAHELEVVGSTAVISAAEATRLPRLIVPSLTALYGARPDGPGRITEANPLLGCPGSRFIRDRVEVERQLDAYARRNPEARLIVLRFAPPIGPTASNPFTRLMSTRIIPTPMGFDPLWQVVHEDDAAEALYLALSADVSGPFNIVCEGTLPFSCLVRESGAVTAPLPGPLLAATLRLAEATGVSTMPVSMLDYVHYNWIADGARAHRELGFVPRVGIRQAMQSLRAGGR